MSDNFNDENGLNSPVNNEGNEPKEPTQSVDNESEVSPKTLESNEQPEQAVETNEANEAPVENTYEPPIDSNTQSEPQTNDEQPLVQPQTPPVQQNNFFGGEQKHYVPTSMPGAQQFNNMPPQPPMKPTNGKNGLKIFLGALAVVLVFAIGLGVGLMSNDNSTTTSEDGLKYQGEEVTIQQGATVKRNGVEPDEDGKYTADEVAEIVGESVVNIQVYSETEKTSGAIASGVILDKSGYIISNDHIYSEVANAKFVVTTSDGKSYKAKYIAGDQRSDISILKFTDMPDKLTPAVFANSDDLKSGDEVIAIGSPYGLSGTVTKGIISSPARRISFSSTSTDGSTVSYSMKVIQTDTALNSGNSGGALVNMYGQVVGISSSKIVLDGYEGLCFAIPSDNAIKYAKSLIKNGKVTGRAKLGITYSEVTSASALVNDIPSGLRIQAIDDSSDLSSKNIAIGTSGDIITEMNGTEITSSDVALDIIDSSAAGDKLKLKVYITKTGKYKTYSVTLLEDSSTSSYTTEIPKQTQTTTNGSYYYYGGNGNDNSGNSGNGNSGSEDSTGSGNWNFNW